MAPIPEKALAALNAMKAIGIPMQTTKPVLKNLLKVYEHNWEYIEAENYRLLADAILDMQESQAKEDSRKKMIADDDMGSKGKDAAVSDEPEPHRIRVRKRIEDHHLPPSKASSDLAGETSLKRPKREADVLPETRPEHKRDELVSSSRNPRSQTVEPALPQPSSREAATPNSSLQLSPRQRTIGVMARQTCDHSERAGQASSHMNYRETRTLNQVDGACPAQVQTNTLVTHQKDKQQVQEKIGNSILLKGPKVEPGTGFQQKHDTGKCSSDPIKPKDEPCDYDLPVFETPIATIRPPQPLSSGNIGQASPHSSLKSSSSLQQNVNGCMAQDEQGKNDKESLPVDSCKKGTTSELLSVQESSSFNVDVASSDLGEVKLSFSCSSDRPDFHVPNLEAVFKQVEDRCLKSYRILQPNFSFMNLMKEMCHCFLELGSETTDDKQENVVQIIPTLGSLKKPITPGVSCAMPACPNNSAGSAPDDSRMMDRSDPCNSQTGRGNNQNGRSKKMKEPGLPESANMRSCSLMAVQQTQCPLGELRPLHDVNDISKGEERVRISVVNEITSDKYPPSFNYIPQNIVYQNAYVNFSLARIGDEDCCVDCFNDCLAPPIPCACARETGGEFAYTLDGRIKKEFLDECISMNREPQKHHLFYCKDCPLERSKSEDSPEACKGHLVRKFVKECWSKCGCSMHCGNRVVQRGITCNLQVFLTSEEKGWGVQTLDELPRGAFVCEYVGEVLTNMELYDRTVQTTGNAKHTYPVLLDADWGSEGALKDEEALCLDATFYGNVARFINHRCFDANLIEIPVEVETPDHHYYHLAFFTTRKVEPFEELTWDYGIDFDDHDHPVKAFRCRCGSRFCRDIKRRRIRSRALVR